MKEILIRTYKLDKEAKLPRRKQYGDAGMDFYCLYNTIIPPHSFKIVQTGIATILPKEVNALLKPKGSSNHLVGAGVIENSYTGEILFKLFNPTDTERVFKKHSPIGQMVLFPAITPDSLEIVFEDVFKEYAELVGNRSGGIVKQLEGKDE